ncbi:MAG: hypothetical protein A2X49_05390 [Lentisphaerae bacterium GWF2_52_8]|nr:MAG: hypothetical protein A2X49_05390 [Lentisphaerae bacterium GWF2_52_8]
MKLSKVLSEKKNGNKLFTIGANASLKEAAKEFCEKNISCLLVVEEDSNPPKYVGILTERDVIKQSCVDTLPCGSVRVADIMSRRMIVARAEDDVKYLMAVMSRHNIHHLPIIENNEVSGIISMGDIIRSLHHEDEIRIHYLSDYASGTRCSDVF